jgi:hypothetical protein
MNRLGRERRGSTVPAALATLDRAAREPLLADLERTNDRVLPADYAGDVLIWDIDKTYLDTRFSSWRGLLTIPVELAVDKRTIPGAVPLLRGLRRGVGARSHLVPLYFVSGSPPQLRGIIQRKMDIDGVEYDGITFKDQLGLVAQGRFRAVKAQVGYKLRALLLLALELPPATRWWMFGDDVESDATVFALAGEVLDGLKGATLDKRLIALGVEAVDRARILPLAELARFGRDPVERIFIHLENGTDPAKLQGPRVTPTRSFLQTALVLARLGRVEADVITAVARDLRQRHVTELAIAQDLDDAAVRLGVPAELIEWAGR